MTHPAIKSAAQIRKKLAFIKIILSWAGSRAKAVKPYFLNGCFKTAAPYIFIGVFKSLLDTI
jgi:hypothetical protein